MLLVLGRNGQCFCLVSPFFCPSSKIALPKARQRGPEARQSTVPYNCNESVPSLPKVSTTDMVLVLDIESDCGTFVTDVDVKPLVPVGVEVVVYVTRFGQTSLAKEHVDIWI